MTTRASFDGFAGLGFSNVAHSHPVCDSWPEQFNLRATAAKPSLTVRMKAPMITAARGQLRGWKLPTLIARKPANGIANQDRLCSWWLLVWPRQMAVDGLSERQSDGLLRWLWGHMAWLPGAKRIALLQQLGEGRGGDPLWCALDSPEATRLCNRC